MLQFVNAASVICVIDEDIAQQSITIRLQQKLKLPDAIIAATALVHNLTLITRTTKDFAGIPGLSLINPWEL